MVSDEGKPTKGRKEEKMKNNEMNLFRWILSITENGQKKTIAKGFTKGEFLTVADCLLTTYPDLDKLQFIDTVTKQAFPFTRALYVANHCA